MTRAEYKTGPHKTAVKDLIRLFNEHFLPKKNTYHTRRELFWTRQTETETPEDVWRRLIEIEKGCSFERKTVEKFSSQNSWQQLRIQNSKTNKRKGNARMEENN